ncbi:MAG: hypothetical protein ACXAEX_01005 [Promethearchaeota archaeon]|jgi:hypothetical protein
MQLEEGIENGIDNCFLYSEQHLKTLAEDQIWKGKGVDDDPFIIENANVLGQTILIKKSTLVLSFKNCNFDHVLFEVCENVSMHNCTFRKLSLKRCKEFEFKSCYISDMSFSKTRKIYFKNSLIIDVSMNRKNKDIIFEDCQINDIFLDSIESKIYNKYHSKIKETAPSYIIIFSSFVFYRIFYTIYILNSLDLINMLLIMGVVLGIVTFVWFLIYDYFGKKKPSKITILHNDIN